MPAQLNFTHEIKGSPGYLYLTKLLVFAFHQRPFNRGPNKGLGQESSTYISTQVEKLSGHVRDEPYEIARTIVGTAPRCRSPASPVWLC
jgi:hypothetical protein